MSMKFDVRIGRTFAGGFWAAAMLALSAGCVAFGQSALGLPIELAILAGLPCACLASLALARKHNASQRIRDAWATGLVEEVRAGRCGPYSLYLRTFAVTGALPSGREAMEMLSPLLRGPAVDLETVLAQAVAADAPLVALGNPGEHLGAGRILTEEGSWREQVRLLWGHAERILVIPSGRAGTAWEIENLLAGGLWRKTVFVMPPRLDGAMAEGWDADRARLARLGVRIPGYLPAGALFTLDGEGRVLVYESLDGASSPVAAGRLWARIKVAEGRTRSACDAETSGARPDVAIDPDQECPHCSSPRRIGNRGARGRASDVFHCAACGRVNLTGDVLAGLPGFLICLCLSVVCWLILAVIHQRGTIQEVIQRPRLDEVLTVGLGVLFLFLIGLAFPYWCFASLYARWGRTGR